MKNGLKVQRFLCRECGYRFSDPYLSEAHQPLLADVDLDKIISIKGSVDSPYDSEEEGFGERVRGVENTGQQTLLVQREGEVRLNKLYSRVSPLLKDFMSWMMRNGYSRYTIKNYAQLLDLLERRGANLYDPESVKATIMNQNWENNKKAVTVEAYNTLLKFTGGRWDKPKVKWIEKLPFIPTEEELDKLIYSARGQLRVFLLLLKETGMRMGEACALKWSDVDLLGKIVRVVPEKGSRARVIKISNELVALLNTIPRKSDYIFGPWKKASLQACFLRLRKRLAKQLNNPRFIQITFHTFRHWKGTMEYAKTKDLLYVRDLLGHKCIQNTLKYTHLVNFKEDEYIVKTARTVEEACKLLKLGFDYVTEMDGLKIFRRRK